MNSWIALFDYRPARWSETVNGCATLSTGAVVLMMVAAAGLVRMGVIPSDAATDQFALTTILVTFFAGLFYGSWRCARYDNQRTDVIRARLVTLDKETLIALAASPQVRKDDRDWVIDTLNRRHGRWALDLSTVRAPH